MDLGRSHRNRRLVPGRGPPRGGSGVPAYQQRAARAGRCGVSRFSWSCGPVCVKGLRGGSLAAATSAVLALGLAVVHAQSAWPISVRCKATFSPSAVPPFWSAPPRAGSGPARHATARWSAISRWFSTAPACRAACDVPASTAEPGVPANHAEGKTDVPSGRAMVEQAEVTLVSPACQAVFDCPPEDLLGPYAVLARAHRSGRPRAGHRRPGPALPAKTTGDLRISRRGAGLGRRDRLPPPSAGCATRWWPTTPPKTP